jgi:hypothetical protein
MLISNYVISPKDTLFYLGFWGYLRLDIVASRFRRELFGKLALKFNLLDIKTLKLFKMIPSKGNLT